MKHPLTPLVAFLLVVNGAPAVQARTRAKREDDIRAVVVWHMMPTKEEVEKRPVAKRSGFDPPPIQVFYLSYWSRGAFRDPSDQFLQRFRGGVIPLKKASDSYVDRNAKDYGWSFIKDRKTQQLGARLDVGRIRWLSSTRVDVRAGYVAGGVNASHSLYSLRFSRGHGKVVKLTDTMVS